MLFMKQAESPPDGAGASTCLLCGHEGDEVERIDVRRLIAKWKSRLGINIGHELKDVDDITEHRCRRCGLLYFLPAAAGSEDLYRQLQELPWYYSKGKWEHHAALRDIPANAAVLEVGCGSGVFSISFRKGVTRMPRASTRARPRSRSRNRDGGQWQ